MTFRRNLVRDPEAVNLLDWAVSSGAASTMTTANTTPMLAGIATYAHVVATVAGAYLGATQQAVGVHPVTPGQSYILSTYLRPHTAAIVAQSNIVVQWLNAAGGVISTTSGTATTLTQDASTRVSVSGTAPALAVRAALYTRSSALSGNFAIGAYVDIGPVMFEAGAVLNAFYDGNFGGAIWDGASNGSTSTLHIFGAPVVTFTDDPPIANISLDLTAMSDDVETLTLYRVYADRPVSSQVTTTVRRGVNKFASGGFATTDEEVPIGMPVSYYAALYRADGVFVGNSLPTTVTVGNTASIDDGWISDPLVEGSAIKVTLTDVAGSNPSRPMVGTKYQVGYRTVVLNSRQSHLTDLDMGFYTDTKADMQAIQDLIEGTGGLVLIRCTPPRMVPRMLYCWMQNASPDDFNYPAGLEDAEWANTVQETSAVEGDVTLPAVSWQTYIDAFSTWANMEAAYTTWFDAKKNPPA